MICKKCNGKGYIHINVFGTNGILRCDVCGGNGKILSNQQTNEEWRRTCSVEEFAEWVSNLAYACMRCGMSNGEAYCHTGYCIQDKADAEKWLKEIHDGSV